MHHDPDALPPERSVAERALLWIGGAGGGLDGPAGGIYGLLAERLAADARMASLRLHYREPNELDECVMDAVVGVDWLCAGTARRVAVIGHSFGGAVAIAAGVAEARVGAVAAMSSQTYGAHAVSLLSPRPLLLVHGAADEVLPPICSRWLFEHAGEPRDLRIYAGARHGLDECRDELEHDLAQWLSRAW